MENSIKHIAFIMDGNRRWAKSKLKLTASGHKEGANTAEKVIDWCIKREIKNITLWALSTDNWKKREDKELSAIFNLIKNIPSKFSYLEKYDASLKIIGSRENLPNDIVEVLDYINNSMYREDSTYHVYIAINYGGRDEIINMIKNIQKNNHVDITEGIVENYLYTKGIPDVDLIVRTGGSKRLSGFMPWQSIYSELYFTDTFWPAFNEDELDTALSYFYKTKRNFGK